MGDFSFLSDSDDDRAVEELLSQAAELSVLEQVAAINCAGFTDSVLPTHLESRFAKLKSFPSSSGAPNLKSPTRCKSDCSSLFKTSGRDKSSFTKDFYFDDNSGEEKGLKENLKSGFDSKCSKSMNFAARGEKFPELNGNSDREKDVKENVGSGLRSLPSTEKISSFKKNRGNNNGRRKKLEDGGVGKELKSPSVTFSDSSESSIEFSPPRRGGCLWCSPKRASMSKRKGKENREVLKMDLDWRKNDEYLSELSTFSAMNKQKLLKKAMKEEEKISREAEKIVKWAKQASARMEAYGVEDELSDDGSFK